MGQKRDKETGKSLVLKNLNKIAHYEDTIGKGVSFPKQLRDTLLEIFNKDKTGKAELAFKEYIEEKLQDPYIDEIIPICEPTKCYNNNCPFKKEGTAPVGRKCPILYMIALRLKNSYIDAIRRRMENEMDEIFEIESDILTYRQIIKLVEYDITEMIADQRLGKEGLLQEIVAVVDKQGVPYFNDEMSVIFKIKKYIEERRDAVLEQLLLTPKIKAKFKIKSKLADQTSNITGIDEKAKERLRELEILEETDLSNPLTITEYETTFEPNIDKIRKTFDAKSDENEEKSDENIDSKK